MKKINFHNYEAFFLDYSEGNLNADEVLELQIFLAQNPELKSDLQSFENSPLPETANEHFTNKSKLKRDETFGLNQLEMLLIGKIENELNAVEEKKLKVELQDPKLEADLTIYQKTKLRENPNSVFGNKEKLKKHKKVPWFKYSAVAAVSISILFFWFSSINQLPENNNGTFSEQEQKKNQTGKNHRENMVKISGLKPKFAELSKADYKMLPAKVEKLLPVEALPIAEKKTWKEMHIADERNPIEHIKYKVAAQRENTELSNEGFVSIPEFVKNKIQKDILKDQVHFQAHTEKKRQGFALNIGNFELIHSRN